jgi:hypothetical protein
MVFGAPDKQLSGAFLCIMEDVKCKNGRWGIKCKMYYVRGQMEEIM